jgi:hypothetical protein
MGNEGAAIGFSYRTSNSAVNAIRFEGVQQAGGDKAPRGGGISRVPPATIQRGHQGSGHDRSSSASTAVASLLLAFSRVVGSWPRIINLYSIAADTALLWGDSDHSIGRVPIGVHSW